MGRENCIYVITIGLNIDSYITSLFNEMGIYMSKNLKKSNTRWPLVVYDVIVYIIASILLLWIYGGNVNLTNAGSLQLSIIGFVCIFICRMIGNIYGQIWRYGGIQGYIRLIFSDAIAFMLLIILQTTLQVERITFDRALSLVCVNLVG